MFFKESRLRFTMIINGDVQHSISKSTYLNFASVIYQIKRDKKTFCHGLRPLLSLSNYLYANKFAPTNPTDTAALRADKT